MRTEWLARLAKYGQFQCHLLNLVFESQREGVS